MTIISWFAVSPVVPSFLCCSNLPHPDSEIRIPKEFRNPNPWSRQINRVAKLYAALLCHNLAVLSANIVASCEDFPGMRLSQPQHVRQPPKPWNFARSFGNPCCCGWDTRAPFWLRLRRAAFGRSGSSLLSCVSCVSGLISPAFGKPVRHPPRRRRPAGHQQTGGAGLSSDQRR